MAQIIIIAAFLIVFMRETIDEPLLATLVRGPGVAIAVTILGMAMLWVSGELFVLRRARRLDRNGSWREVERAEAVTTLVRVLGVLWHGVAVLGLGWLDAVRDVLGGGRLDAWSPPPSEPGPSRWIVLDTLIAVAPLLLLLIGGWWSFYRIDRRLREAVLIRELEAGSPVSPPPTRTRYVLSAVRHQIGLVLIPIVLIAAWNGALDRVLPSGPRGEPWWGSIVRFAGIGGVLALMPLVMRRVWDTVALGPGELRERLLAMCREQRVGVRELLVWRTDGAMINGAVMGFLAPARYILLTDALLERLPVRLVEAVTAHELGHVRRRHMLWLGINGIGAVMLAAGLVELGVRRVVHATQWPSWVTLVAGGVSIGLGLLVFGFASRRFEWQADAFAVQHLSRSVDQADAGPRRATAEAAAAMSGALEAVARLNHIPLHRFTWRHGSIADRRRRLAALVGHPLDRLKPDRDAGLIKLASLCMLVGAIALAWGAPEPQREPPNRSDLMRFVKMEGIGNDYVYLDAVREPALAQRADLPRLARAISDRHFGVGSDGLILVCQPSSAAAARGADVRMRMLNADGSESEMCGNGVRCVAKFAHDRLGVRANPMRVETGRGVLSIAYRTRDDHVDQATVDMGEPILEAAGIPVSIPGIGAGERAIGVDWERGFGARAAWLSDLGTDGRFSCVSMGNPHAIIFGEHLERVDLERVGPSIERAAIFPNRVNAHLVRVVSRTHAQMRTWERGAGITLACGTGACAVLVAGVLSGRMDWDATISLPGGPLEIRWDQTSNHVFMTGPARDVFEGEWTEGGLA